MAETTLQRYSTAIDEEIVDPLRTALIGRQIVAFTPPAGKHVSNVEWTVSTELSDGLVSYEFVDGNEDTGSYSQTSKKIPYYWKDYTIDRNMLNAFEANGQNVEASIQQSAAYKAAKVENSAIIMGVTNDGTNYDIDGLYTGAGNDYSTTADFATAGKPTTAVSGALALLEADDIPVDGAMNLILNTVQRGQLRSLRGTSSAVREEPEILEMLNGGRIIGTSVIGAGTGLLLPEARSLRPFVDFYLRTDWKTEHGISSEHPETGPVNGRVYTGGVLRIKESDALCKLSDI